MKRQFNKDFYQVQSQQWKKNIVLLFILIIFYFFAIGFVTSIFLLSFGLFFSGFGFFSGNFFIKLFITISILSVAISLFHLYDARKFGAQFIRRRLGAKSPDSKDRYHKRFINTLEEMRIAGGLPKVQPYIIPTYAINSMALIEADKSPSVIVTEGLLADFTRDELQAVIAHELAHILRGDAFFITLACSLANFFERLRQAVEPEMASSGGIPPKQKATGGGLLLYLALTLSSIIMHLISTFISREREILADAAAVELSRNPKALAQAIYKAHVKNSFVGEFNLTYSPLFIVPPHSRGKDDSFFNNIFNSHPPLIRRICLLTDMIPTTPAAIINEVMEIQKTREKSRVVLHSPEEKLQKKLSFVEPPHALPSPKEGKIWLIRTPKGKWEGPHTLEELVYLRSFSPLIWIKNIQEQIEAPARDFPQVKNALVCIGKKKHLNPAKQNLCPRCNIPLKESYYEGVAIKFCPKCLGKLIDSAVMSRIITRKEVNFSDYLEQKAKRFQKKYMANPFLIRKITGEKSKNILCPNCGAKMLLRPYTYYYVIPVDKCLSCQKIWFDTDEMEILQLLIEEKLTPYINITIKDNKRI